MCKQVCATPRRHDPSKKSFEATRNAKARMVPWRVVRRGVHFPIASADLQMPSAGGASESTSTMVADGEITCVPSCPSSASTSVHAPGAGTSGHEAALAMRTLTIHGDLPLTSASCPQGHQIGG